MMARSVPDSGGLEVWNGYREAPSAELVLWNLQVHENRLVPQYPPLFPVLAHLPYRLAGLHGLFLLNALAFIGVAWLCHNLAYTLFRDRDLALRACLIFVLATYAWEYSQGIWPHMLALLFTLGAVRLGLAALNEKAHRRAALLAIGAGLLAGLGTGVRLDVILVLPALVAPFLFSRPVMPRRILQVGLGLLPGLALLTAANREKFGDLSPFSYGSTGGTTAGIEPYLPLVAAGVALLVGVYCWRRRVFAEASPVGRIFLTLPLLAVAIYFSPRAWHFLVEFVLGAWQIVVDLRSGDIDFVGRGSHAVLPGGAVVYYDHLKKSLLQSCPYLVVLVIPLAAMVRDRSVRFPLSFLFLPAAIFIGTFSFLAWHGGLSFNMRYLLPALPFTAILTAYAWKEIGDDFRRPWLALSLLSAGSLYLAVLSFSISPAAGYPAHRLHEEFILTFPLVLALFLLAMAVIHIVKSSGSGTIVQGMSHALLTVCLTWAFLVSFGYDFARVYTIRKTFEQVSNQMFPVVSDDAILFADFPDPLLGLLEKEGLRIAVPRQDNNRDFGSLIDFHLNAGRPVYGSFSTATWHTLQTEGLLESLQTTHLAQHPYGSLQQIRRPHSP